MTVDAGRLHNCISSLLNAIDEVRSAFRSDWDDVVHESFKQYLSGLDDIEEQLKTLDRNVENVCSVIASTKDSEEFASELKAIESEIKGIRI